MGKREILEARLNATLAELEKLEAIPDEPDRDEVNVIWFEKTFNSYPPRVYTYAAVKAGDGLWYTTGPRSPKGYSWEQLWEWIHEDERTTVEVWLTDSLVIVE